MTNDEGGTDNEDSDAAVIDRVITWQALLEPWLRTMSYHPDPFTHDEYYKFMAFYNDTLTKTYDDYPC
jgi:hypothetical protein